MTTKDIKTGKFDLRKHPFRGILAEIAREDGVERQAVQKRARRGDPDTLARIAVKARARVAKVNTYRKLLDSE